MENLVTKEMVMERLKEIDKENIENPTLVNGMMAPKFIDCDLDKQSITVEFSVKPWMKNRVGILHGGIICSMLDHVSGATIAALFGTWSATVDMNVHFIRPSNVGDVLIATGKIQAEGKTIVHVEAFLENKETGKLLASCLSTFYKKQPK